MPRRAAEPRNGPRDPLSALSARAVLSVLEQELSRLPDGDRMAIVCCCLEALTVEEAAAHLGCTVGALRGRLQRGRARLHGRLVKRGLMLGAALAAAEMARRPAAAGLIADTVQ